ncbi:MAG: hypothetical protein P8Y70_16075 [Candidatus Lokiarchaeota archaeon]
MCAAFKQLDKAYFLFLLDSVSEMVGPDLAKGILQRIGIKTAGEMVKKFGEDSLKVDSLEKLLENENPLTIIDDTLEVKDNQILILEKCPFAELINSYLNISGSLPPELSEITHVYNEEGLGYAVSPFCIIHQTIREEVSKHIKVNGKNCKLLQLGCKSSAGEIKFADDNIDSLSIDKDTIENYLAKKACSYSIRVEE